MKQSLVNLVAAREEEEEEAEVGVVSVQVADRVGADDHTESYLIAR